MLKLIGLLTLGYAGHRGYEAQKAGVPISIALKAPFTKITELKTTEPVTEPAKNQAGEFDPDRVMVPDWMRDLL